MNPLFLLNFWVQLEKFTLLLKISPNRWDNSLKICVKFFKIGTIWLWNCETKVHWSLWFKIWDLLWKWLVECALTNKPRQCCIELPWPQITKSPKCFWERVWTILLTWKSRMAFCRNNLTVSTLKMHIAKRLFKLQQASNSSKITLSRQVCREVCNSRARRTINWLRDRWESRQMGSVLGLTIQLSKILERAVLRVRWKSTIKIVRNVRQ